MVISDSIEGPVKCLCPLTGFRECCARRDKHARNRLKKNQPETLGFCFPLSHCLHIFTNKTGQEAKGHTITLFLYASNSHTSSHSSNDEIFKGFSTDFLLISSSSHAYTAHNIAQMCATVVLVCIFAYQH